MIAAAGTLLLARGDRARLDLSVDPGLPLSPLAADGAPAWTIRAGCSAKPRADRAKKSWGQNFLVDRGVLDADRARGGAAPDDVVVEIGAGLGALTARLPRAEPPPRRIIAVERDPDMLRVLRAELAATPRGRGRAPADAAELDFARRSAPRPAARWSCVGNLPYQIGSVVPAGAGRARGRRWRARW